MTGFGSVGTTPLNFGKSSKTVRSDERSLSVTPTNTGQMNMEYEYDADESTLMGIRGARARDYATGEVREDTGEARVIRFIDDGYRIYATWSSGAPDNLKSGQCILVAEYKHCDIPALGFALADALMKA
jgi:hypothetical protein